MVFYYIFTAPPGIRVAIRDGNLIAPAHSNHSIFIVAKIAFGMIDCIKVKYFVSFSNWLSILVITYVKTMLENSPSS